jgi:predicted permease
MSTPMARLREDLRFASRMLVKNPTFTAAAVLTLALGIGLNAAVFSAIYATLFQPLPEVRNEGELVQLYRTRPGGELYGSSSIPHYQDLRDRVDAFGGAVAAWTFVPVNLSVAGQSERVTGDMVSGNYFDVLGAPPALGRGFLRSEARDPGAHRVVVLGHAFWQTRLGGDPSVVGRTLTLNGKAWVVVGVGRKGFKGAMPIVDPQLYVPLMMQRELIPGRDLIGARDDHFMNVVARLAPGVTEERARLALNAFVLEMGRELPAHYEGTGILMVPQREAGLHPMLRSAQLSLSVLTMAVVALLLLIACVNVANLFLARAGERRTEIAVRLSLGATRSRIVSQLLTESALFALISGGVGVLLAWGAIRGLNSLTLPVDYPVDFGLTLNWTVLAFTGGVSVLAGVVFGLAPAVQASRPETVTALKGEVSLVLGGRHRLIRALVVAQAALSVLVLVCSGLFIRGLRSATLVDKGFNEENLLLASVDPALQGYDRERTEVFYRNLESGLRALPGVEAVGFAQEVPLSLSSHDQSVDIPGYVPARDEGMSIRYNVVTPGYFEAMQIPLLEGRPFRQTDSRDAPPALIVNRHFADRFWPGANPIGKIVRTAGRDRVVVGVVKTGKYFSLGEAPQDFMYLAGGQVWRSEMTIHLRVREAPESFAPLVRREVRRLEPTMPVADLRTMTAQLGISLFPVRLGGATLGIFGLLAMLLASVGVYGVMAYAVSQRVREIGIRIALGANRRRVIAMIVREGMALVGVGAAFGLVAGLAAGRLMGGLIYGVSPIDPVTFVGVPGVLSAVALAATLLPARRAASVDPMVALRAG